MGQIASPYYEYMISIVLPIIIMLVQRIVLAKMIVAVVYATHVGSPPVLPVVDKLSKIKSFKSKIGKNWKNEWEDVRDLFILHWIEQRRLEKKELTFENVRWDQLL